MQYQRLSAADIDRVAVAACGDDATLSAEINAGIAEFFELGGCAFVVRAEQTTRGKEIVICCVEGKGLRAAIRRLVADARQMGFEYLRYHPTSIRSGYATARMAGESVTPVVEPDTFYMILNLRG